MSHKLPAISYKKLIKILISLDYVIIRQKGSHVTLFNNNLDRAVTVPKHKEIGKGTLLSIIKQADLTRKKFMELNSR